MKPVSRPARAFVLLEVLISLTILAVTVTATLRSFSQSLSAIRQLEVRTMANFFAQQILDEFELTPPYEEGESEGGFGDDYAEYYYTLKLEYEEPDYNDFNQHADVDRFFPMRIVTVDVYYDNGRNKPLHAAHVTSAIMGFERYSREFKMLYGNF